MKSRVLKTGICITILISLLIFSFALIRPIYLSLGKVLKSKFEILNNALEESYGLNVSYSSLSPSILTGINIKSIVVKDAQSDEVVIDLKNGTVKYSLLKIIQGDYLNAISEIIIYDVSAKIIQDENTFFIDYSIKKQLENKSQQEKIEVEKKSIIDLLTSSDIEIKIPFNISINNLNIKYENQKERINVTGDFRKVYIQKNNSHWKYNLDFLGKVYGKYKNNAFSTTMLLRSSLMGKINNSSAVVNFLNTSINSYSVSQIGFLAEYVDSVFVFKMLPTVQNVYLEFSSNLKTNDLNFSLDCNNFKILNIVSGIKKETTIGKIADLLISTNLQCSYNFESTKFNYSAKGDVKVPSWFVKDGIDVAFAINGNQNYINIPFLKGIGQNVDIEFSGGMNLRTIQPEGLLSVNKVVLSNEEIISSQFFIEPLDKGFMIFAPEILIGQKTFTAAQFNLVPAIDGYDFSFEVSDYSHIDSGETGVLRCAGNYITSSKFLQTNISVDGFYIDSVLETSSSFLNKSLSSFVKDIAPVFKNTIFTTDIYLSSYDGNFSYSIPSVLIADSYSDDKMLIMSLDGNKENIQLNRFEFVFNDQKILATAHAENMYEKKSRKMQTMLSCLVEYNTIPYAFSGMISEDWFSLTGDYGFDFSFLLDSESENLLGNFALKEFPIKTENSILSITTDSNFYYNAKEKINLNVLNFIVDSTNGITNTDSTFMFTGKVNKEGVYFDQIGYTDLVSNLNGNGAVFWNFKNSIFENANYNITLNDLYYNEQVLLSGDVSNPTDKPFSTETLLNDYYISCLIKLSNFRTGRFVNSVTSDETMNAEISVTGILSNPLVSIIIPNGSVLVSDVPLNFSLYASVVDLEFELESANIKWGQTEFTNIKSKFSFKDWKGFLDFDSSTQVLGDSLIAPINVSFVGIKNEDSKNRIPDSYKIDISTPKVTGNFVKTNQPLSVHITKMAEELYITSSSNIGLAGSILENGDLSINVDNQIPFKMKVSGNTKRKNADLVFYDINVNLAKTINLFNFEFIKIYNGTLVGDFKIIQRDNRKEFDGLLQIIPAEFSLPEYFSNHAKTDVIDISLKGDKIETPKTRCLLKRSPVDVTVSAQFDNLSFESLTVLVKTVDDTYAPININMPQVHVKGNAQVDLDINIEPSYITVLGSIVAKDTNAEFGTSTIEDVVSSFNQNESTSTDVVEVILDVKMQSRVQVFYSSFLRGLVVPNSNVVFSYSSLDDKVLLDGDVALRSGEIIYLNSSFYVKEGKLEFSDKDGQIDPYISLRAETRERDSNGEEITVLLAVDHQKLQNLSPKLTSSPAKSEREIMELLGVLVSAKSDDMSSFMLATGDYALQTVVMRRVENALRDLLNFDILSIRTMVVQNALKYSISKDSDKQGLQIGNFLDNTTVYMGKYFGGALYLDAMLRLAFDKNRINDGSTLQGLIFKPEFGLEMDSPIAKIRWSLAPDLSDVQNFRIMLVPSLTLSWRFNF